MPENILLFFLMRSRAVLIGLLALVSGWTTWLGLRLFIEGPIALVLTAAVQTILIIATYQLSKMYVAISPRRYYSVASGLATSFCVSVFFSYFAFYTHSQSDRVYGQKLSQMKRGIESYVADVLMAKAKVLSDLDGEVVRLNGRAEAALEGRLLGVRPGIGPIYLSYKRLADEASMKLTTEREANTSEKIAQDLNTVLGVLSVSTAPADETLYRKLQERLVVFQGVSTAWLVARGGKVSIVPPTLPPIREFEVVRPSLEDMARFSPVAFSLAFLVDLFAILLTWWLDSVPFGQLSENDIPLAMAGMSEFTEWGVSKSGQLEFATTRTEAERYDEYRDFNRLYWTTTLLSLGLLRRTSHDRCEFTPRLYTEFARYRRAAGPVEAQLPPSAKSKSHSQGM